MNYEIKNEKLQVKISDYGAELQSVTGEGNIEYLWQGNPEVWEEKAPNIFPYVARLTDGKCMVNGTSYEMKIHGIVKYCTLKAEKINEDEITFCLESNEETKKQYPFDFTYRITYTLEDSVLKIRMSILNQGNTRMYFALGGHPGFQVPLEEGLSFEDYYLEFGKPCKPSRIGFSETCFLTGKDETYSLVEDRFIPLRHELFDNDAIVLKHCDRQVTLASFKGKRRITASYPDFPYLGFWHMPKTEAPYICIEPWSSLPSREGIVEELSQQADLIGLEPGKEYITGWQLKFE